MAKNPVLDLPLTAIMRPEIALPLQHILQIYTVGNFLQAWRNPKNQKSIEQIFDNPRQARHAAATCAAFLGVPSLNTPISAQVKAWWPKDDRLTTPAA